MDDPENTIEALSLSNNVSSFAFTNLTSRVKEIRLDFLKVNNFRKTVMIGGAINIESINLNRHPLNNIKIPMIWKSYL